MKYIILIFIINYSLLAERNWELVKPRFELEGIKTIECHDSLNCYAFSRIHSISYLYSRIYKSEDLGKTWFIQYQREHLNTNDSIWNLGFGFVYDAENIYYTDVYMAIIEKSTDGGKTFKRKLIQNIPDYNDNRLYVIKMYNKNLGAAVAERELIITKDNWETSEVVKTPANAFPGDVLFFIDSNNIAMSREYRLGHDFMRYDIKNHEWSLYFKGEDYEDILAQKNLSDVFFISDSVGFACGWQDTTLNEFSKSVIWKTTNRGKYWEVIFDELHYPNIGLSSIRFRNASHGIAVGGWGMIVETSNGGKTWNYITPPKGLKTAGLKVAFAGESAVFSTAYGGIYRLDPLPLSIEKNITNKKDIKVIQTLDELKISIKDSRNKKYRLEIIDVMGRRVIESTISSGIGNVYNPINIEQLNNGSYFYAISIEGVLFHSGKFIK